jgi:hypothetical protein
MSIRSSGELIIQQGIFLGFFALLFVAVCLSGHSHRLFVIAGLEFRLLMTAWTAGPQLHLSFEGVLWSLRSLSGPCEPTFVIVQSNIAMTRTSSKRQSG